MTTHNSHANMNADAAFEEFSRSISICIFNRMLGVVSLVLIIVSSMCLLLCYWLLTGSRYVEQFMVNICADIDIVYFKSLANDIIQIVSDSANELVGRNFVSKTKIKNEFSSMLERHLAPDWAAANITDDETSSNDTVTDTSEVEIKEETIDVTPDNNNNDDTYHTSNENDTEVVVDNSNDVIDNFIDNVLDNILNNVVVNPVSTTPETDNIDSEIDDITEQCLAEKRENRTIIDLQSDNED